MKSSKESVMRAIVEKVRIKKGEKTYSEHGQLCMVGFLSRRMNCEEMKARCQEGMPAAEQNQAFRTKYRRTKIEKDSLAFVQGVKKD